MEEVPRPPWRLHGESILAWCGGARGIRRLVPAGLRALPGPAAIVANRYTDSPVGPYLELSVAVPARLGLRPALCVVAQVVSIPASRVAYRRAWGLPTELGSLVWDADGDAREVRWEEKRLAVRAEPAHVRLPVLVPVRSVQRRADGPVVVPRRLYALMRLARTTVTLDDPADDLAPLAGPHAGAILSGMRLVAHPARRPTGLWSSLRAPLHVPEPAVASPDPRRARYSDPPLRAHSSVG